MNNKTNKTKTKEFDFNKCLVSIKRVDELHSPTGKSNGFILEFNDSLGKKLENYEYYGIRLSECEMWCSENSDLGQWLTKYLAILYSHMEADVYYNEVKEHI